MKKELKIKGKLIRDLVILTVIWPVTSFKYYRRCKYEGDKKGAKTFIRWGSAGLILLFVFLVSNLGAVLLEMLYPFSSTIRNWMIESNYIWWLWDELLKATINFTVFTLYLLFQGMNLILITSKENPSSFYELISQYEKYLSK